jgi:hypothetical protein
MDWSKLGGYGLSGALIASGAITLAACAADGRPGETAQATDGAGSTGDGGSDTSDPSDGGTTDGDTGGEGVDFDPAAPVLPRLTATQYRNALVELFGQDLPPTPVEPDTNPYLFYSIGATSTTISELGVQQYEEAAEAVTSYVFADAPRREALLGCVPSSAADTCVEDFIATFGRRAYRRPLTDTEQSRWLAVAAELGQTDPWDGVRLVTAGLLQSPYFLYRVELGEADPDDASIRRFTGYEMASRLSFLLTNSIPDDTLLDAAEAGDLDGVDGLREQAQRLLEDPRSRVAVQDFFSQFLDLGRIDGVSRDTELYPDFTASMPASMKTEVQLLVDDLVYRSDSDVRALFSTRRTFVNEELAQMYGVDAPGASPITFVPVELPVDGPRAGILTLGAFLTMNAHETQTSPTLRGKYVRERVLCQDVPPPPPDVDTSLDPDSSDAKTLREELEKHRENPACASCHAFIDPPGFLFENFDSAGTYRTTDNGYPIDASGDLDGMPLANARDLAEVLASDERVGSCMVTQLFRHTNGRLEAEGEAPALADLDERFASAEYRFQDLLLEFVTHDSFRIVANEEDSP